MGANLVGRFFPTGGNNQDRSSKVSGDISIKVKLKTRILPPEVSAFAQDKVVLRLQLFILLQDIFVENLFLPSGDKLPGLT